MARTLYSFQEEGWRVESGQMGVVTVHPEVRISVSRHEGEEFNADGLIIKNVTYTTKMFINVGDTTIGIAENEYASIEALMDDLGIDDIDEVWEILE